MTNIQKLRLIFQDNFQGQQLNHSNWLPHYLPHWSTQAASKASYSIKNEKLRFFSPKTSSLGARNLTATLKFQAFKPANMPGHLAVKSANTVLLKT
ncbi:hypothetical protein [Polycladidibacter stylochi]|uniref:hypothetical protein n=1 Tax=Polycladidibacter stylochi TaxID=1807766 RepID=UPI0008339E49|nr:hypothetical protein [Pseudovibrio stylochi]